MTRTARTPSGVMNDAVGALANAGWEGDFGADADHLKTPADVDATSPPGSPSSRSIRPTRSTPKPTTIRSQSSATDSQTSATQIDWFDKYLGKRVRLSTGTTVELDEPAVMRAAVKYGRALNRGIELADYIRRVQRSGWARLRDRAQRRRNRAADDARRALHHRRPMPEPRNEAGVARAAVHRHVGKGRRLHRRRGRAWSARSAIITRLPKLLGPYKLSLHSGSDKLSIYPALARATKGRFHVKTAGTSYLEALRVVAIHDAALFRRICEFARGRYDTDKATYHVHATLDSVPPPVRNYRRSSTRTDLPGALGRCARGRRVHGSGPPDSALHVRLGADRRGIGPQPCAIAWPPIRTRTRKCLQCILISTCAPYKQGVELLC